MLINGKLPSTRIDVSRALIELKKPRLVTNKNSLADKVAAQILFILHQISFLPSAILEIVEQLSLNILIHEMTKIKFTIERSFC